MHLVGNAGLLEKVSIHVGGNRRASVAKLPGDSHGVIAEAHDEDAREGVTERVELTPSPIPARSSARTRGPQADRKMQIRGVMSRTTRPPFTKICTLCWQRSLGLDVSMTWQ